MTEENLTKTEGHLKPNIDQLSGVIREMGKYTGNDETKWFDEQLLPQYLKHKDILKFQGRKIAEVAARKILLKSIDKEKYKDLSEIERNEKIEEEISFRLKTEPGLIRKAYKILEETLMYDLVDTAKVRLLDDISIVRAYATAPYHENPIAQWKDTKNKLLTSIKWDKNDYPQWYISGARGSGKSYFETVLMTLAMEQRAWIYTTKVLKTTYKRYYNITRRSDLYIGTRNGGPPSVLEVYMAAKRDEQEYGFPSSLYAVVIKDEGGTGKEAKYQSTDQGDLRTEWQFGRHTRCVYITAGFQKYNPKTMKEFITHYAETAAKETIVMDVDGKQKKYHVVNLVWPDGTEESVNIPPTQLAIDSNLGLNIATEYINDLDIKTMFEQAGYNDALFEADPQYFIDEFARIAMTSRNNYNQQATRRLEGRRT